MENITKFLALGSFINLRYLALAGLAFLLFYKLLPKKVTRQKIQKRDASRKDFIREIKHSLQSGLVFAAIGLIVNGTSFKNLTLIYSDINAFPLWWIPVSVLVSLIIHDTYFYWMHRIVHHKNLFKYTHLVHHKSTNPSPWTSYSFNFTEAILEGVVILIIVMVLPMHMISIVSFTLLGFFINVYGHLGYEIAPKFFRRTWLFEVLNTSIHHNMHHSKNKGNYGLYFRVWDRIMGTENPDYVREYDRIQERRFGITSKTKFYKAWIPGLFLIMITSVGLGQGIEGNWRCDLTGDVVNIYEQNGLYYGKVIASHNPTENKKLQTTGKQVLVFQDFEPETSKPDAYCCGTFYLPGRKINAEGTMQLTDNEHLEVTGHYLFLHYSTQWTRVN